MNYALALTETGSKNRSKAAYEKVIRLDPLMGEAYDLLARLQFSTGESSEAKSTVAALERAVPGYRGLAELKALVQ